MENTESNKVKFFSNYFGQTVFVNPILSELPQPNIYLFDSVPDDVEDIEYEYLLLKPISSITDEDAQKCGIRNAIELLAMNDGIYMSYSLGSKIIALGYYIGEHIGENYPLEYGWVRLSE